MVLARIGSREGLEFVARTVAAPNGPQGWSVAAILQDVPVESPTSRCSSPRSSPCWMPRTPARSRCSTWPTGSSRPASFWPHPAASRLARLRHSIESESDNDQGPALAACYALAMIPGPEALVLLERATQHPDPEVRLEALYAGAARASRARWSWPRPCWWIFGRTGADPAT